MSFVTRRVAEYLSGVADRALPEHAAARTCLHLLDTVAAMVSGSTLEAGQRGIGYVRREGISDDATVIGGGMTAPAADAAFANGMSAHADETDDSHPAGFHPGCAIVAASLVPLKVEQLCWVLSYTAQQAWGARSYLRDAHHVEKAFVYGERPARAGVMAATMVQRGFDAVDDVFDGEFNYLDAVGFAADRQALSDGLGQRWEIMRTNIKRYPVGSPILGVVEAFNRLLQQAPSTRRGSSEWC